MTKPRTEAGKRLAADLGADAHLFDAFIVPVTREYLHHALIAIEQEARTAALDAVEREVAGLAAYAFSLYDDGSDDRLTVSRPAVLDIIKRLRETA